MKKLLLTFNILLAGFASLAQTPRLVLYEEFTGENCGPCASTNPGLDALLQQAVNQNKIVAIKWQVPIPSAPSNTWSLYQTNLTEINWRYSTYGYGVNSAPNGRIDGQNQPVFGAASDHPAYMSNSIINTVQSYTSPFSISMTPAWSPTYTAVTLTVNIQASANYTSVGALVFRLVLIEKEVHFASQSGTNGEKDFYHPVRRSYPSIQAGTPMAGGWINGQTQTFTINCVLPSYIVQKGEIAFVGFIQDDGNRKVLQSFMVSGPPLANDAKAVAVVIPTTVCSSTVSPQIVIENAGNNAITNMTINPYRDLTALTAITWTGNLAPAASTTVSIPQYTSTGGTHSFSYNIVNVAGGDMYTGNNTKKYSFVVEPAYFAGPVTEGFILGAWPPANWGFLNPDAGAYTWGRVTTCGGYATSFEATKYNFYDNPVNGDVDDLYLPPTNLTGVTFPVLNFDYAYAPCPTGVGNNVYADKLEVMISTNCGQSWTSVWSKTGSAMGTVPATTVSFVASAASQWTSAAIAIPSLSNNPTALVIFRATNDYGNNLFIDNINLDQGTGVNIAKISANPFSFDLYPNPTNAEANIIISSVRSSNAKVAVVNMLGQLVFTKHIVLNEGITNVQLESKDFASGIYNVILETEKGSIVKKLTVTK